MYPVAPRARQGGLRLGFVRSRGMYVCLPVGDESRPLRTRVARCKGASFPLHSCKRAGGDRSS